jgi:hypothetical protein
MQFLKKSGYNTNLNYTIDTVINKIMEKGYTKNQAKKLLACELIAGWNTDSILDGIDRIKEEAIYG